MRMSCNGCRVLRKGCADDCVIRPCLHWIPSPDAQANATLFLAKFYGRAGLLNLISAGPPTLRPAIFRSLLYEACGRIVNPVEGSVGLLYSGNWARCESAVDGVLRGTQTISSDGQCSSAAGPIIASALSNPAIKAFDIRHVSRESNVGSTSARPPRSRARSNNLRIAEHATVDFSDDDVELELCLGLGAPPVRRTGPTP